MPGVTLRLGGYAAACAAFLLGVSSAKADITFCNDFTETVFVAIAYQQEDESWLSRGWLELGAGGCAPFDTAIRVKTFYYRGESAPYKVKGQRKQFTWADGSKQFAIWEDDNFQYWNAEEKVLNSSLADFSKGPLSGGDELTASVTITFTDHGTETSIR